jgi:hypothetical protein
MSSLSRTALHEYYVELGNSLPPPIDPTPEYRERRFTTAVETFNALRPANANEALLAVKVVACGMHAIDALRQVGVYHDDFAKMARCRAQAASMMRGEQSARRTLAQEQKMRLAVEAVAGSAPVQPALPAAPPQPAEPHTAPLPMQAATPALQPAPVAAAVPPAEPPRDPAATNPEPQPAAGSAPPPSPEAIAKAEAFVEEDIVAAAQIRYDRGVTPKNKAHLRHLTLPTDPELIDALVRGASAVLTVLDEIGGEDLDAVA